MRNVIIIVDNNNNATYQLNNSNVKAIFINSLGDVVHQPSLCD